MNLCSKKESATNTEDGTQTSPATGSNVSAHICSAWSRLFERFLETQTLEALPSGALFAFFAIAVFECLQGLCLKSVSFSPLHSCFLAHVWERKQLSITSAFACLWAVTWAKCVWGLFLPFWEKGKWELAWVGDMPFFLAEGLVFLSLWDWAPANWLLRLGLLFGFESLWQSWRTKLSFLTLCMLLSAF